MGWFAIFRRRSVSLDNHPATPAVPWVPCPSKTRQGFELDRRNAGPRRTDSFLRLLELSLRARRDQAIQAVARLPSSPCWKDASPLCLKYPEYRATLPLLARS